jgi:hypothetical protein
MDAQLAEGGADLIGNGVNGCAAIARDVPVGVTVDEKGRYVGLALSKLARGAGWLTYPHNEGVASIYLES